MEQTMRAAILQLSLATDFAARRHVAQRRKGAAAEPYINHLTEVARLLAEASDGHDLPLVLAGLLHDTLEDTATGFDELAAAFGEEVARLVQEVTDDKRLPKAERKRLQVETAPSKSPRAKMIKIADKTSNLRALAASPPVGWDEARQRDYFLWAERVIAGCRGLNPALEAVFDQAWQAGMERLAKPADETE